MSRELYFYNKNYYRHRQKTTPFEGSTISVSFFSPLFFVFIPLRIRECLDQPSWPPRSCGHSSLGWRSSHDEIVSWQGEIRLVATWLAVRRPLTVHTHHRNLWHCGYWNGCRWARRNIWQGQYWQRLRLGSTQPRLPPYSSQHHAIIFYSSATFVVIVYDHDIITFKFLLQILSNTVVLDKLLNIKSQSSENDILRKLSQILLVVLRASRTSRHW